MADTGDWSKILAGISDAQVLALEQAAIRIPSTTFEEGMVLALEPAKDYYHIQDMVVVRARGPQWISDKFKTDQMFVIE